jgi:hypothetical protein
MKKMDLFACMPRMCGMISDGSMHLLTCARHSVVIRHIVTMEARRLTGKQL